MSVQTPPDFDAQRALEIELESRLKVGDFDMDKMMDVVEVMWRNRDKIMDTVDNVWDNWDDIMATVDVVMRNRQAFLSVLEWTRRHSARLVDLADALPDLLHKTGDGIEAAGNSARQAGRFLAGSKDDDATSASELMDLAAHALEQCRVELDKAAELLGVLGDEIDDIRIPRLSPRFVEVMGVRVVSGVDVGEANLMDTAAKRLKGGASRLAKVGVDLETVAGKMRNLGGQLTEAGADLQSVGDQLGGSGDLLRSLSLLDLSPAAEEEFEITVEIPARGYAAGTLGVTRGGSTLDLEPETPSTPAKPKSTKPSSAKSASAKKGSTKKTSAKATAKASAPETKTAKSTTSQTTARTSKQTSAAKPSSTKSTAAKNSSAKSTSKSAKSKAKSTKPAASKSQTKSS